MTDCPVLIASSHLENRRALASIFVQLGLDPLCSANLKETCEALATNPVSIIFCDKQLSDGNFKDLLAVATKVNPEMLLVVTSRMDSREEHLETMRLGVFDVIPFPCHATDVDWVVIRAMREWRKKRMLAMTA